MKNKSKLKEVPLLPAATYGNCCQTQAIPLIFVVTQQMFIIKPLVSIGIEKIGKQDIRKKPNFSDVNWRRKHANL